MDAMRSFYHYVVRCQMNAVLAQTEEERRMNSDMIELLTPLIKDYLAVRGHEVCIQAIQIFGGGGYTKDYLVFLRAEVQRLLDEGGTLADAYRIDQSAYSNLDTFEELAARNAGMVFEAMEFE